MTTKSTVAQMLVAERVRQLQEESDESDETTESEEQATESEDEDVGEEDGEPAIFERHPDKWYVPNTQKGYKYAVRLPESADTDRKYYKTVDGAVERLRQHYE